MPLDPGLTGRTFDPTEPYLVSREKIGEFTAAIGADRCGDVETAPLTFPIVVAFKAMERLLADPDIGVNLRNVVHGAQRFEQTRPLHAGDVVTATLTIESVRSAAGADLIGTRTEVATTDSELVCTAFATLVHRSNPS